MKKFALRRALAAMFISFTITSAQADRLDHLSALSHSDYFKLDSETLERPFHIYVRTPLDYNETEREYPVVYLLDGDILFPIFGAYHYLLQYDEPQIPEAIIVGISYGSFDPEDGNYRGVDYSTPPLPEEFRQGVDDGDRHGGAARFQRFLKYELIPEIEKSYRADAGRRILVGQSRGGHFTLYSAYTEPDLFWGRIASNASMEPNKDLFFSDEMKPDSTNVNLYVSSSENDIPALREDALNWFAQWEDETEPWTLETRTVENGTHAANITDVYRDGLVWMFSEK